MKKGQVWKSVYCILYFYINTSVWVDVVREIPREDTACSAWSLISSHCPIMRQLLEDSTLFPTPESLYLLPWPRMLSSFTLHMTSSLSFFEFHLKCPLQREAIWITLIHADLPISLSCVYFLLGTYYCLNNYT